MQKGGFATYGKVAGIIMLDSLIPRIPGDPGHAQTFPFPVSYAVATGLPFSDLVEGRFDNVAVAIACAKKLELEGVSFVAADCGLFSLYQERISHELSIPFLGSALSLIPLLLKFAPPSHKIGILTGHTGLLKDIHLRSAGVDPAAVVIAGMENSDEFRKVVIERGTVLDPEAMRRDTASAADALVAKSKKLGATLGAVVIECTNLISFRDEIQDRVGAPVYDLVSLIELFADGFSRSGFYETYRSFRSVK